MKRRKFNKALSGVLSLVMAGSLIPPLYVHAEGEAGIKNLEIYFNEPVSEGALRDGMGGGPFPITDANNHWQQLSLPIGNSHMGANIYGEVGKEHLTFNHKTLWNGGPSESRPDYNGGNKAAAPNGIPMADYVKQVQNAFLAGDDSASNMCNEIKGESNGYGAYQSWGDIYLDFDRVPEDQGDVENGIEIVDDRDARIVYDNSGWGDWSQPAWNGGTEKFNEDVGSFTFEFEGTGIAMIGVKASNMCDFDVYIDDMETPRLSGSMGSDTKVEGAELFSIQDLEDGVHTLKFQSKLRGSAKKTSYDCLKVTKAVSKTVDLNPGNSDVTGVQYVGTWDMWNRASESDGKDWVNTDEMFVEHPDADTSITYTFQGTGISLYGARNTGLGKFTYSIDGGNATEVDTKADKFGRQKLFAVTGLPEGEHTIVINSTGGKLSFDCFVVNIKAESEGEGEPEQPSHTETTNYRRWLNLEDSVAGVEFERDNTRYYREYFANYPDNVIAMKLTAEGEQALDFDLSFPIDNDVTAALGKDANYRAGEDGTLTVWGQMRDNQMKFNGKIQVITDGEGTVEPLNEDALQVKGAREAVIIVTAGTDYKNNYPGYRTGESDEELAARVDGVLKAAVRKGYDSLKSAAVSDYQNIFSRVSLDLGQVHPDKPTGELLAAYNANTATASERSYLEVLLFQYGRYLQIASSREGDELPANLQGVWNDRSGDHNLVPWASDYHMNVNLQMNYWPTYVTNMAECGIPMINYIDSLREPGRVTASTYFGIDNSNGQQNGYSAHTQNTPFGWTCPGWDFSWGWSPAAVPWMLQNVYEYYEYTGDVEYLREKIFPMMEEEAKLYEQILKEVTYENGVTRLATVPAFSPEHGPYTAGNVYENSLVWQLFNDCIEAGEILNQSYPGTVSEASMEKWQHVKDNLKPIEIGDDGQIKEWYEETTLGSVPGSDERHRHMSHMLGLFPGDLITVDNTEYIEAAKLSLTRRGDDATGWGMGQRLNSWARVGDGDHAYQIIKAFFNKGAYPNLWDAHQPFQIDGNFGYTSGVAEMLMQSNVGYINLLPALPQAWQDGTVSGLVARGNFEVSESWESGVLTKASLLSKNGGVCQVQYPGLEEIQVTDEDGNKVASTEAAGQEGRIKFDTEKGKTYILSMDQKKAETVTITFDTDGGSAVEAQTIEAGGKAVRPGNPTKAEYEFVEWQYEGKAFDFDTLIDKSITLKAVWKPVEKDKVTVTFDTGAGSKIDPQTFPAGGKAEKPENPVWQGREFVEWQYQGVAFDFNTPVNESITLTAVWKPVEKNKVTVTFDTGAGSKVESQTFSEGGKAEKPENPVLEGYEFVEWQLDGKTFDFSAPVETSVTLKAVWRLVEKDTVTVTFDTGSGSKIESQTFSAGGKAVKPEDPVWKGHSFVEWQLDGKTFDFSTPVETSVTLKAVWKVSEEKPAVDKSKLQAAVDKAVTDFKGYTDDSVKKYKAALERAREVLKDKKATQKDVDKALEDLQNAKLVKKSSGVSPKTGDSTDVLGTAAWMAVGLMAGAGLLLLRRRKHLH